MATIEELQEELGNLQQQNVSTMQEMGRMTGKQVVFDPALVLGWQMQELVDAVFPPDSEERYGFQIRLEERIQDALRKGKSQAIQQMLTGR